MNETRRDEMVMGQGIRSYRPSVLNPNRIVNRLFAPSARTAFPDMESAVIVQQKKVPDISFWQGVVDWDLMRAKTDTIIIRAGQNTWEDIQFKRNWAEAKKRGMKRGTYYFYDDRASPGIQAEKWHSLIKDDPPELECIVDWENSFGGAFRGLANVVSMMERMEDFGYLTAKYTGYYWFVENSNAIANKSQYAYLKTRPLHLAWYTDNAAEVLIPFPWLELWLWQFGTPAEGPAHGAGSEEIDMNFVNMTTAQFYTRYGGATPQPEPVPPVGDTMQGKIKVLTNIRSAPGVLTTTTDIGDLLPGDIVIWDRGQLVGSSMWYHLTDAMRGSQPVRTSNGVAVSARTDCWCYSVNVEPIEPTPIPPTPAPLPVVTISVDGDYKIVPVTEQSVEVRPR